MKLARPTPNRRKPATNTEMSTKENGEISTYTLVSEEMKNTRVPKAKKMRPEIARKLSRISFNHTVVRLPERNSLWTNNYNSWYKYLCSSPLHFPFFYMLFAICWRKNPMDEDWSRIILFLLSMKGIIHRVLPRSLLSYEWRLKICGIPLTI